MSDRAAEFAASPNDLRAYWMPYTANRQFKSAPRMISSAKGMYVRTTDGRDVLDAIAGLWCVNAGHCRPKIVEAIQNQVAELDYSMVFQMGHPKAFQLATRLADLAPDGMEQVFFTNSGSEAADTALKIALAYHKTRGEGGRFRLIGRERGYHGVNFGGTSVGGMVANRKMYGTLMAGVDHLRHTHDPVRNGFTPGQPEHGVELAEDLVRMVQLHDPSTIAAVIVEPVAGSAGVLPPPVGYLQRLREICDEHGILLIFDEVITGFGRVGAPFAAERFGVTPDMINCAKGLTNGTIPMGAVIVGEHVHDAFMQGPEHLIELLHGYTYSGNPVACAAALATLETYKDEGLLTRALELESYWAEAMHSFKGTPGVTDIRSIGLVGALDLEPVEGMPTKRAFDAFLNAYEKGMLFRTTGDTIAFSPPLIIEKSEIDKIVEILTRVLKELF